MTGGSSQLVVRITPIYKPWSKRPFGKGSHEPIQEGDEKDHHGYEALKQVLGWSFKYHSTGNQTNRKLQISESKGTPPKK